MRLTKIKGRRLTLVFCSVLMITLGVCYWIWVHSPVVMLVTPAFDFSDDRKLAGSADNIFIGEVRAQVGRAGRYPLIETQFAVQVLENIKGNLPEKVVVNQQGGKFWGQTVLIQGDRLVESGKVYLFVTSYNQVEEWHTLVYTYGRLEITTDLERQQLVVRFQKAYQEQIEVR